MGSKGRNCCGPGRYCVFTSATFKVPEDYKVTNGRSLFKKRFNDKPGTGLTSVVGKLHESMLRNGIYHMWKGRD